MQCPSCGLPWTRQLSKSIVTNHVISLAVFVLVALAYVGYSELVAGRDRQGGQTEIQSHGMPPIEKDQFVANLPDEYAALVSMGNALMDRGQYDLAVECYRRALEQQPKAVDVRVDMGTCQHALGENQRAITNFKTALEHQPDHEIAKFNLGIVYFTLGDKAQAVEWWNRLLEETPSEELKQRTQELIKQAQEG
jgi:tetratricopeptide (TPR) repeat protein